MSPKVVPFKDPRGRPRAVDPNITMLEKTGLYVRETERGTHEILCPWRDEHEKGGARYATYFEKDYNGHAVPAFHCFHAHCDGRGLFQLLDFLGVKETKDSFAPVEDDEEEDDAPDVPSPGRKKVEPELVTVKASKIEPEHVDWAWDERIARGKITIVAGNPGTGKSQFTIYLSARITTGGGWPMNEGTAREGSVLMLSAEDSPRDTIVPRLIASGADLERVEIVQGVRAEAKGERGFDLAQDLRCLEAKIDELGDVALVVIDPITAYGSGTKMDWNSTGHVRTFLKPVAELAERCRVAVVIVAHLNKKQSSATAQMAVSGSVGQVAAARSVWIVVEDRDDPERKLFLSAKNTNAPAKKGLAYRIVAHAVTKKKFKTSAIEWEPGYVEISADEAMEEHGDRRHTRNDAIEWLRGLLAQGAKPAAEVREAAAKAGYSKSTLDRAKDEIGVRVSRSGFGGRGSWTWRLMGRRSNDEGVI